MQEDEIEKLKQQANKPPVVVLKDSGSAGLAKCDK